MPTPSYRPDNPDTYLSSVNSVLAAIGQAPVEKIDQDNPEIMMILQIIMETTKDTQAEGWVFNTENHYPMEPDSNGYIEIKDHVLRLDISEGQIWRTSDVVRRPKPTTDASPDPVTVEVTDEELAAEVEEMTSGCVGCGTYTVEGSTSTFGNCNTKDNCKIDYVGPNDSMEIDCKYGIYQRRTSAGPGGLARVEEVWRWDDDTIKTKSETTTQDGTLLDSVKKDGKVYRPGKRTLKEGGTTSGIFMWEIERCDNDDDGGGGGSSGGSVKGNPKLDTDLRYVGCQNNRPIFEAKANVDGLENIDFRFKWYEDGEVLSKNDIELPSGESNWRYEDDDWFWHGNSMRILGKNGKDYECRINVAGVTSNNEGGRDCNYEAPGPKKNTDQKESLCLIHFGKRDRVAEIPTGDIRSVIRECKDGDEYSASYVTNRTDKQNLSKIDLDDGEYVEYHNIQDSVSFEKGRDCRPDDDPDPPPPQPDPFEITEFLCVNVAPGTLRAEFSGGESDTYTVTWKQDGKEVQKTTTTRNSSSLKITRGGRYCITVENDGQKRIQCCEVNDPAEPLPDPIDLPDCGNQTCPPILIQISHDGDTYTASYDQSVISDVQFINPESDKNRRLRVVLRGDTCDPTQVCGSLCLLTVNTAKGHEITDVASSCKLISSDYNSSVFELQWEGKSVTPGQRAQSAAKEIAASMVSVFDEVPVPYGSEDQCTQGEGADKGGAHCVPMTCDKFQFDCYPKEVKVCADGCYTMYVSSHGCDQKCGPVGLGYRWQTRDSPDDNWRTVQDWARTTHYTFKAQGMQVGEVQYFRILARCTDWPSGAKEITGDEFTVTVKKCGEPELVEGAFYPGEFSFQCCLQCPDDIEVPISEDCDTDKVPDPNEWADGTKTSAVVLYDKMHHSFEFPCCVLCDVVWLLPFPALPPAFQRYITSRASVRAAAQLVNNPQLFQLLQQQEATARAACMEYETTQGDYSFMGFPDGTVYQTYQPWQTLDRNY